jgi:exonuclease III
VQPHADITGTHNRCNVTISRWPIDRRPLTLRNIGDRKPRQLNYYRSHFPEKMLVTDIDTSGDESLAADVIDVWNVGIINGANWGEEKVNMLETVYGRIALQTEKLERPVILGGDFNAPMEETSDREIIPHGGAAYTRYPFYGHPYYSEAESDEPVEYTFGERWRTAEKRLFDPAVGDWGMQDAYLASSADAYEASTLEYTHIIHNGNPARKRLDHVLASDQFTIHGCEIWNGRGDSPDGFRGDRTYRSDHAPVVAELSIDP